MASLGEHTFVDGVGGIEMRDGVMRMDLLALSPTQRDKKGHPIPQFVNQLVMSPPAFLRMVSAMGATVKQMQDKGLVSMAPADEAKGQVKPASKTPKAAKGRKKK